MLYKFYDYNALAVPDSLETALSILERHGITYRVNGSQFCFLAPYNTLETLRMVEELEGLGVSGSFGNACFLGSETGDIDAYLNEQEGNRNTNAEPAPNTPTVYP